jgi:hypothetical protein
MFWIWNKKNGGLLALKSKNYPQLFTGFPRTESLIEDAIAMSGMDGQNVSKKFGY